MKPKPTVTTVNQMTKWTNQNSIQNHATCAKSGENTVSPRVRLHVLGLVHNTFAKVGCSWINFLNTEPKYTLISFGEKEKNALIFAMFVDLAGPQAVSSYKQIFINPKRTDEHSHGRYQRL